MDFANWWSRLSGKVVGSFGIGGAGDVEFEKDEVL